MGTCVVVIGLGQLGRRYLEGVLQATSEVSVWAVDSSEGALERAQDHVSKRGSPVPVEFLSSFREVPSNVDLVISATTADSRAQTLRQLLGGRLVRYVILEKLLTQSLAESEELMRLSSQVQHVWVNYPRRIMAWHGSLGEYVQRNTPVRASVVGRSWGLITNGLHFIDLFEWWTGSCVQEIQIRGQSLDWSESKRPGFLDAIGTVEVKFLDGSILTLQSNPEESQPHQTCIDVHGGNMALHISESDGLASGSMLEKTMRGRLELQSEMTGPLVDDILKHGACGLPSLQNVLATHNLFIDNLLAEQKKQYGPGTRLPVT